MANGKIILGKQSGGTLGLVFPDGVSDTEVVLPESGELATVNNIHGFKNYIINGNFDIWQRGVSQTSSGYGSDDRWDNNNVGSTKTHSRVVCSDVERALFNANYFSRTVVTSVAGSDNYCTKIHRIEDVTKIAGKTVTLSFWAKADSNKNIAIDLFRNFGSGGTPSPIETGICTQKIAVSAVWKKYSITVTLPSLVGKTLGTDGVHTSATNLYFWFEAGSNFNNRTDSLGQQSGTFDIAQVQLEEGSVATPFEQRPIGLELSLCQRYYEYGSISFSAYSLTGSGYGQPYRMSCVKRVIPTVILADLSITNTSAVNLLYANTTHLLNGGYATIAGMSYWSAKYTADAEL